MIYNRKSRRQFLVGVGGTLLAIPFLPSLLPRAYAAGTNPMRFIALGQDEGRYAPHWYPNAAESSKLRAVSGVYNMREMLMRDIVGDISPILGAQFNGAMRDKLLLIKGLDIFCKNHGHRLNSILAGCLAPGASNGDEKTGNSVDYVLANNLKSNPLAGDPRSHLNFRIDNGAEISFRHNAADGTMKPSGSYLSPLAAFNSIFGNSTTTQLPSDRKLKVVDQVLESYRRTINSPKLARAEKHLLQEHIDTLNQVQSSAISNQPMACVKPSGMADGLDGYSNHAPIDIDRVLKQQMDLMVAAIKCGSVNIGTIMMTGVNGDNNIFGNLNGVNCPGKWHDDYAHGDMSSAETLAITRRMANFFSYFINQLNIAEPGTNGTYLDNSLVFWGNAMSDGKSHNYRDMQVITAGSLGGRIKAGKYINYANDQGHGRTYNAFLVAILQAFGLSEPDYKLPNIASGFGCDGLFDEYLHRVQIPEPWRNERASPSPGILV